MKMRTLLLSASISLLVTSCAKIKDPEFRRLDNFGVQKLGLKETTIGVDVVYFNPNNFGVTVKEAEADLYIDTIFVGKFTQPRSIEVGKNAEFAIPLSGGISLQTALKLRLTDLKDREVSVRADGSVKVGKGGVFVSRPVKYQGKHKVDLSL